jgi:hypothetical protein
MMDFFKEGGWGMYPVLVMGLVVVWTSVRYGIDCEPVRLRFITAASLALVVFSLEGVITDVATVLWAAGEGKFPDMDKPTLLIVGMKESSRPGIMGLAFLGLGLIAVTIGVYRAGRRELAAARGSK